MGFLSHAPYQLFRVVVTRDKWIVEHEGEEYPIDKNDFSFTTKEGSHITFDYIYNTIHGTPGEDGLFTGYLDMLHLPYSCCPTAIGALTFDKYLCNHYLASFGITTSPSVRLRRGEDASAVLEKLTLPLFVKPNAGGSSLATNRVEREQELLPAIEQAFGVADTVMVEELIQGTEVTCGIYEDASGLHPLPVTEVVPKNLFFDYEAKYQGAVEEITPARISDAMTAKVQRLTEEIYRHLGASGIVRVDFIIREETPVLLEVNTTPGMTETSFIPQQVAAAGLEMGEVLERIIEFHLER